MKILIAEDDATSLLLLQTTLKQWGNEVGTKVKPELEAFQAEMDAKKRTAFVNLTGDQ
jgi:CheY-like chemotaxis protein